MARKKGGASGQSRANAPVKARPKRVPARRTQEEGVPETTRRGPETAADRARPTRERGERAGRIAGRVATARDREGL
jgi:hypothetical protein